MTGIRVTRKTSMLGPDRVICGLREVGGHRYLAYWQGDRAYVRAGSLPDLARRVCPWCSSRSARVFPILAFTVRRFFTVRWLLMSGIAPRCFNRPRNSR